MESQVGCIVILKKIIFKRTNMRNKATIDHAYKGGRPALIICETDEKIYHLLLTHSCYDEDYENGRYFPITDVEGNENGFIDFSEIHTRTLCYENECEYINDEDLHDILVAFCKYQENCCEDEEYEEIRPYLYNLIKELSLEEENCLKKIKK